MRAVAAASYHVAAECRAAGAPAELVHTAYPAAWGPGDPPAPRRPPRRARACCSWARSSRARACSSCSTAARSFLRGRPAATLTVLGEPTAGHEDYAGGCAGRRRPRAAGRVELAGFAPDAAAAMTGFDLVVVPSLAEPYGTVSAEAAAAGRPAVISAVGGMAEVVLDGVTGLHVPPGDPAALAAAVGALLDDPAPDGRHGRGRPGARRALLALGLRGHDGRAAAGGAGVSGLHVTVDARPLDIEYLRAQGIGRHAHGLLGPLAEVARERGGRLEMLRAGSARPARSAPAPARARACAGCAARPFPPATPTCWSRWPCPLDLRRDPRPRCTTRCRSTARRCTPACRT